MVGPLLASFCLISINLINCKRFALWTAPKIKIHISSLTLKNISQNLNTLFYYEKINTEIALFVQEMQEYLWRQGRDNCNANSCKVEPNSRADAPNVSNSISLKTEKLKLSFSLFSWNQFSNKKMLFRLWTRWVVVLILAKEQLVSLRLGIRASRWWTSPNQG